MDLNSDRIKIKSTLIKLSLEDLVDLAPVFGVEVAEAATKNSAADTIVDRVLADGRNPEEIERLASFYLSKKRILELTNEQLCLILKIDPKRKAKKDDLLKELRTKFQSGELKAEDISLDLMRGKLLSIKRDEVALNLAQRLGYPADAITLEDLVIFIRAKMRNEGISEDTIYEIIEQAENTYRTKKAKEESATIATLYTEVLNLQNAVNKLKPMIEELHSAQQRGFRNQYWPDVETDLESFLKAVRDSEHEAGEKSALRYDIIVKKLKARYPDMSQLMEKALITMIIASVCDIASMERFSISRDDFMNALRDETRKQSFATSPVIYKVREKVMERLGIEVDEFNRFLIDCRESGLVVLIEGSPASEKEDNWISHGGRRYFYFNFEGER